VSHGYNIFKNIDADQTLPLQINMNAEKIFSYLVLMNSPKPIPALANPCWKHWRHDT